MPRSYRENDSLPYSTLRGFRRVHQPLQNLEEFKIQPTQFFSEQDLLTASSRAMHKIAFWGKGAGGVYKLTV